jgi:arsenate reductase
MPSDTVTIYAYNGCSSCRKALQWLRARSVKFVEKPIREQPPTVTELRRMLAHQGGNLRKLFNVSGLEYRALGLTAQLPAMSEADALALLASNGSLVKRPFLLGKDFGLTGFDESAWAAALGR